SEVDLECSRFGRKQTNLLPPEYLGDKNFFALPANGAVLAYWTNDMPIVVPDLVKPIRESSHACSVNRERSLHEKSLVRTLFIETVLECDEALALFGYAQCGWRSRVLF